MTPRPPRRSHDDARAAPMPRASEAPDVPNDASAPVAATQGDALPGPSTGPAPSHAARNRRRPRADRLGSRTGRVGVGAFGGRRLAENVGPTRKRIDPRCRHAVPRPRNLRRGPAPSFIRDAAKAFERRGRDTGTGQGQQGAKTEEAIERGLEFLARSQQEDGSWSFQKFPAQPTTIPA